MQGSKEQQYIYQIVKVCLKLSDTAEVHVIIRWYPMSTAITGYNLCLIC